MSQQMGAQVSQGLDIDTQFTLVNTQFMHCIQGDEWEEKWGEWWASMGRANKWADKWAKDGTNVWHEKWGEEYDGEGGCVKFTDKVTRL